MLDQATVTTILAVLASGAAIAKFIVHLSVAPIRAQNTEILKTLKEISETLKSFQIEQAKENGKFVTVEKYDRDIGDIYNQIETNGKGIAKIQGSLG